MRGGKVEMDSVDLLFTGLASSVGILQEGGSVHADALRIRSVVKGLQAEATGTAVRIVAGELELTNAELQNGYRGLDAADVVGPIHIEVDGAKLAGFTDAALAITGDVAADLENVTVVGSNVGLRVTSSDAASDVTLSRSGFTQNGQNVVFIQREDVVGGSLLVIVESVLGSIRGPGLSKAHAFPYSGSNVAIVSDLAPDAPSVDSVIFARNQVTGSPVGVFLSGGGVAFLSSNNTFRGNTVGLQANTGHAVLSGDVFESTRHDFFLAGPASRLVLTNERFDQSKVHITSDSSVIETESGPITRGVLMAAAASGASVAALAAAAVFSHAFRDGLLRLMFIPLYARLSPHEVMSHDKRKEIVSYLDGNGGAHLRAIGRALNLTYGTLTYHLYRLEKEGIIVTSEDGLFKRYYLSAGRRRPVKEEVVEAEESPKLSLESLREGERQIFEDILAHPGSPQAMVAERLGLSRQALHYHIKRLSARGYIRKVSQGRETLCYANLEPSPPSESEGAQAAS
ncbi:MAG TPA: winged helix-turn-helix transcriptional regulator [Candidatus Thermoplasmatota archaeon]|nr:winged helix-turn-helix transcriptional regulator [Candidatus Thermoplasmatota archaeon]